MTEHYPKFITQFVSTGKFYDDMPMWYTEVGNKIVKTMMINAMMPFATTWAAFCIPVMKKLMDKPGSRYTTKKTSMAKYKALYGGGNYVIHFKYSNVLNVTYITMMYGIGMPLLFPCAMINFLNQYICERWVVAFYMRQPPSLDDKLIRSCIRMLKWAPLLMLANGFWMLSNH